MTSKRKWTRILLVIAICAGYGLFVSVWNVWKLHNPGEIPREMAYLAGITFLGIVIVSEPKWRHFRMLLAIAMVLGNMGCGFWLLAGGNRLIGITISIVGALFIIDLLGEIEKLRKAGGPDSHP